MNVIDRFLTFLNWIYFYLNRTIFITNVSTKGISSIHISYEYLMLMNIRYSSTIHLMSNRLSLNNECYMKKKHQWKELYLQMKTTYFQWNFGWSVDWTGIESIPLLGMCQWAKNRRDLFVISKKILRMPWYCGSVSIIYIFVYFFDTVKVLIF